MPAAHLTLYAAWTRNSYSVSFDTCGHGTSPDAQQVLFEGLVKDPGPMSEAGYTFAGWYTDPAYTDESRFDFATDTMPAFALTLYALWVKDILASPVYGGEDVVIAPTLPAPPDDAPTIQNKPERPTRPEDDTTPPVIEVSKDEVSEDAVNANAQTQAMSLVTLIAIALGIIAAALALWKWRVRRGQKVYMPTRRRATLAVALALALASPVLFVLLDGFALELVLYNGHTPIFLALFVVEVAALVFGRQEVRGRGESGGEG
jgi:uncharacterized repeat protein (TIGR02543 family)